LIEYSNPVDFNTVNLQKQQIHQLPCQKIK